MPCSCAVSCISVLRRYPCPVVVLYLVSLCSQEVSMPCSCAVSCISLSSGGIHAL